MSEMMKQHRAVGVFRHLPLQSKGIQ